MTDNPVAQFEHNLRRAVGFRSSRNHFDDAIKEISAHYDDLYMEAMNRGATIEEARKAADDKIGKVTDIAKEVRSNNGPAGGNRLQWLAMVLWFLGIFTPIVMAMNGYVVGSLRGRLIEAAEPIGLISVYAAGFLAALGILRAKRVALPAFCLAIILVPLVHMLIMLRFSRSFSTYDAHVKAHADHSHEYAVKYRPILAERYNLYVASISGTQQQSDDAIRKLSSSVKRPQDRGAAILDGFKGNWIYPLTAQKVQERNIRVFAYRDDNLNYVDFGATDSFAVAQKEWRSAVELLKAIPVLRKGSEAEFVRKSQEHVDTGLAILFRLFEGSTIPFLCSFAISILFYGIVTKFRQLVKRSRSVS